MECAAVEQPSRLRGGGRAFFSDSVWERTMVVCLCGGMEGMRKQARVRRQLDDVGVVRKDAGGKQDRTSRPQLRQRQDNLVVLLPGVCVRG